MAKNFQNSLRILVTLVVVTLRIDASPPFMLQDDLRGLLPETRILFNRNTEGDRLPSTITPVHYNLHITPVLEHVPGSRYEQFTAPGEVMIRIDCIEDTNLILLHSAATTVVTQADVTVTLENDDEDEVPILSVLPGDVTDTLAITLREELTAGETYFVTIKFIAKINEDEEGLYQSFYEIETGTGSNRVVEKRYLATTQFEKLGARRAFPCFDEPHLRATFDISIGRKQDSDYHTLSNMIQTTANPVPVSGMDGYVYDTFLRTPNMPTYLIAIIVSDFSYTNATNDPPVKTWGPPNRIGAPSTPGDVTYGQFSADIASNLLTFFEEYFNHSQFGGDPIGKLDSVAIPHFSPGAMENWGLNCYRMPTLLFVTDDMTQFELWRQAAVISHEIAHQWFGNLVTIEWWNNLWLKEGFARYLQFLGVAGAQGDLGVQFDPLKRNVMDTIQVAMITDVSASTHALWGDWVNTLEYQSSRIIYEKGASLIRMMEGMLNEVKETLHPTVGETTVLQRALRRYLDEHKYSDTNQDELFAAIQEQIAEDDLELPTTIKEIMDSWTTQSGYPLVRISRVSRTRFYATQEQYVVDPTVSAGTNSYYVPISFISQYPEEDNYRPKGWIAKNALSASIPLLDSSTWILVNPEAKGYYRVLYDDHFFDLLKDRIANSTANPIPATSRSQLFDDYFNFAFHSYAPFEKAFELTEYLADVNEELVVWTPALTHLRKVYNYLRSHDPLDVFDDLKDHLRDIIEPQFGRMITNFRTRTYTEVETMLLALLMDWVCVLEDELATNRCLEATRYVVGEWAVTPTNKTYLLADLQSVALCRAYRENNTEPTWRTTIWNQYVPTLVVPTNYNKWLYRARGCDSDLTRLKSRLEETIEPLVIEKAPKDHRIGLIQQIAGTPEAAQTIMNFLDSYTFEIIHEIGDDAISTAITALSVHLNSATWLQRYYARYEHSFGESLLSSIRSSITAIQGNVEWSEAFSGQIKCYVENSCD